MKWLIVHFDSCQNLPSRVDENNTVLIAWIHFCPGWCVEADIPFSRAGNNSFEWIQYVNRFQLICQSESNVVTVISSFDCQLQNHVDRPWPIGWIGWIEMPLGKVIVCGPMDTMSFVCMLTNMRTCALSIVLISQACRWVMEVGALSVAGWAWLTHATVSSARCWLGVVVARKVNLNWKL